MHDSTRSGHVNAAKPSESHDHSDVTPLSRQQTYPACRRSYLCHLADLAHSPLILGVILDAIEGTCHTR